MSALTAADGTMTTSWEECLAMAPMCLLTPPPDPARWAPNPMFRRGLNPSGLRDARAMGLAAAAELVDDRAPLDVVDRARRMRPENPVDVSEPFADRRRDRD